MSFSFENKQPFGTLRFPRKLSARAGSDKLPAAALLLHVAQRRGRDTGVPAVPAKRAAEVTPIRRLFISQPTRAIQRRPAAVSGTPRAAGHPLDSTFRGFHTVRLGSLEHGSTGSLSTPQRGALRASARGGERGPRTSIFFAKYLSAEDWL